MEVPPKIRPFVFHGVHFRRTTGDNWTGDCPFCDKTGHFYASPETGMWDCKSCGARGNVYSFLKQFAEFHHSSTTLEHRKKLTGLRGLPTSVWTKWRMGIDNLGQWLLPIRNYKNAVVDLRRWDMAQRRMLSTHGMKVCLFGAEQLAVPNRIREPVYICEGEWDMVALDWLLTKLDVSGICVGVPGAQTFKPQWVEWLSGRNVTVMYDNDKAGDDGSLRAGAMLSGRVASLRYLCWPDELPTGYDVRDLVKEAIKEGTLKKAWATFKDMIGPVHRRSFSREAGADAPAAKQGERPAKRKSVRVPSLEKVLAVFEQWAHVTEDMRLGVQLMLATAISIKIPPLAYSPHVWLFLVAPPSTGKTMLVTSLSGSPHTLFQSSLTAHCLVSGFKGDTDPSLLPKLNGKCFILKDFTEVLNLNVCDQQEIFSTLQGAFDGKVERTFGNSVSRTYESNFSMLAGVTNVIHGNSRATMGERFLKFQMYKGRLDFTPEAEMAVRSVGNSAEKSSAMRDIVSAYLEHDYSHLTSKDIAAYKPEWFIKRVAPLGQLIGLLRSEVVRSRLTDAVTYHQQGESGSRASEQLLKLGICLAIVQGKKTVDQEVWNVVERVAFDSTIGFNLNILQCLMKHDGKADRGTLIAETKIPRTTLTRNCDDLCALNILKRVDIEGEDDLNARRIYAVTKVIKSLWKRACIGQDYVEQQSVVPVNRNRVPHPNRRRKG